MNTEAQVIALTPDREIVSSRFRQDLRTYPPRDGSGDTRHTVYDPKTDLSYFLGVGELLVARLFDGQRTLEDIANHLQREHGKTPSMDKLAAYESKLSQLGLLDGSQDQPAKRLMDPSIGISYGPLKAFVMIPVLRMDPAPMLDVLYRYCRWLCTARFVWLGMFFIVAALAAVSMKYETFWQDAKAVYGGDASWLLWHYPVVVVSIFFHEIGHALTCRHYRVRITDFGIAVYLLLATGWARPLQGDWQDMSKRQRILSIVMGPYASLLFGAVGVFVWMATQGSAESGPQGTVALWHTIGVVMAVSSVMALIPTLLPIFNGDTYLAITELINVPRLRQRAFRYLKDFSARTPHEENISPRRKALYWLTVTGTALGWVVVWYLLFLLAVSIYQWLRV